MTGEWLDLGVLFLLVTGSYGYTFAMTRKQASQESVNRLQERVDDVYRLLMHMNGNNRRGEARNESAESNR
jgi:hypothetical protein